MMPSGYLKDLVVLAADKNVEYALRGLLSRLAALGTRAVTADFLTHPEKDPGCLLRSHDFLRPMQRKYAHALVVFDREGCGREQLAGPDLESQVDHRLAESGWQQRAKAVVIDPELEAWVWSDSPHVDTVLGWQGKTPGLRTWLESAGWLAAREAKPSRPKEAMEQALRLAGKPRSSAIYRQLAESVSTDRCSDAAFQRLKNLIRIWFGN
jgi:hypothetical protein